MAKQVIQKLAERVVVRSTIALCVVSCLSDPVEDRARANGADSGQAGAGGSGGSGGRAGAEGSVTDAGRSDSGGSPPNAMDASPTDGSGASGRGGAGGALVDVRVDSNSGGLAGTSSSGGNAGVGGLGGGGVGGQGGAGTAGVGGAGVGGTAGAGGKGGAAGAIDAGSGKGGAAGTAGAGGASGSGGSGGTGGACTVDPGSFSGHITHYTLSTAMVACHFPTSSLPQYYAAMNEYDYRNAAACGACVEVTNSQNQSKLIVQIVDECPYVGNQQWCFNGSHHVDLNMAAYNALGANNNPAVTWRYVPCTSTPNGGNVQFYWDSGAQQYYVAVSIMNLRYELASVDIMKNGSYVAMKRERYNVWTDPGGVGTGPFTFRLTDKYGRQLIDPDIPMQPNQIVSGHVQFPPCP
jgi:expansin (peptidoglycan-binding protein)